MKNEYHIYGFYSSKTYDRHRLLINLSDKLNLRKSDKCVDLSNLVIYFTWKSIPKQ